jgi:hypothetical protein
MLPIVAVPGRLVSLRGCVILAIGQATPGIANRTWSPVAIVFVRYPSTGVGDQTTGVSGAGKGSVEPEGTEKGQERKPNRFLTPLIHSGFYICDNIQVGIGAVAAISVPGILCTAQAVESAIAAFGGGGGGGAFAIPPGILIASNCNPAIHPLLQQGQGASGAAGDPPINTTPPVTGTAQAAGAAGPSPGNESPLAFMATALGNLGLINGQSGNDGYSTAEADQMVSTIATFDQVEADLAGILATASGEGASLGITGDISLLQTVESRLKAVTTAENLLFGGDANWLDMNQSATLQQWMTDFFTDAQDSTDGGQISAAETTQLLATSLPGSISISEAQEFIDRWNRTVQDWSEGIFTASQVPAGQSTDFLDIDAIQSAFNAAVTADQEAEVDGYSDVGTEVQGALTEFDNDLAGQGTCATIKLQIDQTATLTQTAFSGTLTITNTEGTGPMTNVSMDIDITDAEGNPANGEFFVSSPSYSGANLINSYVTIAQDSPTTFTIDGLTAGDGIYTLTVDATGISDFFGDVGSGSPVHVLGHWDERAGGRERRGGESDPPEYARGHRRRRPLRADRPGVVRLPGAQLDPRRRE